MSFFPWHVGLYILTLVVISLLSLLSSQKLFRQSHSSPHCISIIFRQFDTLGQTYISSGMQYPNSQPDSFATHMSIARFFTSWVSVRSFMFMLNDNGLPGDTIPDVS